MILKLKDIAEKKLEAFNCFLVDIEIRGEKKNKIIGIFIDGEESVDLDKLSIISKEIWAEFQDQGLTSEFSKIDVSSPGAEKPFKFAKQLKKHIGRTFTVCDFNNELFEGELINLEYTDENDALLSFKETSKPGKKKIENIKTYKFSEIKESKVKIKF